MEGGKDYFIVNEMIRVRWMSGGEEGAVRLWRYKDEGDEVRLICIEYIREYTDEGGRFVQWRPSSVKLIKEERYKDKVEARNVFERLRFMEAL